MDKSTDSGNFSVKGYLPLIRKDSITHMHGLAVYVKEGLPFSQDLSLENSTDSYLSFPLVLIHSVPYFFFLYRSPSSPLYTVFDSTSSNIDQVLLINPSTDSFFFVKKIIIRFTPCKAEQPLRGIKLKQKEAQKD